MTLKFENDLPTRSWKFWGILILIYSIILVVTILKDRWLSSEQPNVLFYIFVPSLSILGGVLSMYGIVKISKKSIQFLSLLTISLGMNSLMQIVENILKIIYYRIWEYPSLLYVAVVILLGFLLMAYGLIRWGKVKCWMAVILTVFDFIGSSIVGIFLTNVVGLTTPGS